MANIPQGPALPWATADSSKGVSASKQTGTEFTQSELQPVAMDQLGLSLGCRIEVLWTLEPDAPAEPYQRWWGASLMAADDQENEPPSTTAGRGPAYRLRYDRAPADGFEDEEIVPVLLLGEHSLYDVDRRDVMCWRCEGEAYEPPDESDDGQAADEDGVIEDVDGDEATGGTVSLQQLASGITEADVAAGEAEMLESLAHNPAGQIQMAAGYRDFMDNFK
eukprot:GHUV01015630.1.p1 GENE.GHUV01015630.1~~GHUV01015630.1.p1  ORF type:complete len:221 (+),score=87.19 GHUV01015630.1:248-910(+)